jgi:hypothetical protein
LRAGKKMGCEEDERLLFPSFAFPAESFAEAATPGSGESSSRSRSSLSFSLRPPRSIADY